MKYLLSILISLCVWATLLCGLWLVVPGFLSFGVLLVSAVILSLAISFSVLIILLRSFDSGSFDRQQLSTLEKSLLREDLLNSVDPIAKSGSNPESKI